MVPKQGLHGHRCCARLAWIFPAALLAILAHGAVLALKLEVVSQTPAAPKVGDTLSITFKIMDDGRAPNPTYAKVVWCEPGQDNMAAASQDLTNTDIAHDTWVQYAKSWTLRKAGPHKLYVRMGNQGRGWMWTQPLSFDVAVNYATMDEAPTVLRIECSHTPLQPRAMQPQRGQPDLRDKITLTVTVSNPSQWKTLRACRIRVLPYEPGSTSPAGWMWDQEIPELANGGGQQGLPLAKYTFTKVFYQDNPGTLKLKFHLASYGDTAYASAGHLVATYEIICVSPVIRKFTSTTVVPDPGPHGATFTFFATYEASDNQAPPRVVISLDGQEHEMTRDTTRQGMVYKYSQVLDYGPHRYFCRALSGTTELAVSEVRNAPTVTDSTPPQLTGGQNQQPLRTDNPTVQISGTATDAESGVALVEWSTNKTQWTRAAGTTQWSFSLQTGTLDQQRKEVTVYVRAKDKAGNTTQEAQWWTRKIICDRRHPRVLDTFITDIAWFGGLPSGIQRDRPPDEGPPLMDNAYFVAVQLENPSDEPVTVRFGWRDKEYRIRRREQAPSAQFYWDANMDGADSWGPMDIPLEPHEKVWVNMVFQHRWDWIPPQTFGDFLWALVSAYIPVVDQYVTYLQFTQWGETMHYFIPSATWETVPDGVSSNVFPLPAQLDVVIKVSVPKQVALYSSISAGVAGWMSTACGFCLVWNPPAAAPFFIAQAAFIVTSSALYAAAYDPDPNFRAAVKVEPFSCPELRQVTDERDREAAEAAIHMMEYTQAMCQAFVRYLGAKAARDQKWARQHVLDAAAYARQAAEQADLTEPLISRIQSVIEEASQDQLASAKQKLLQGDLPDLEETILRRAGVTGDEIQRIGKGGARMADNLLRFSGAAEPCRERLARHLRLFADELEKELR
ncbi:MAG: Ig-like domain-containing protein [Armatimonadetes bacterium]|nr:Ig-like domain-containing protein [Armatimonadota bacterium]